MKNTLSFTFAAAAALFNAAIVAAGDMTPQGCFTSTTGLTLNGTYQFNSRGACGVPCLALGASVFALQNSNCWCGNELPPVSMKTSNSSCTIECPGYPSEVCGGSSSWSLYLTGLTTVVSNADASSSDTSSSVKASATTSPTTSAKPSVVTIGGQTVVVTATGSASSSASNSSSSSGSSSPSKTGIAVGVVIGLLAIAAIAGGIFLFVRNRRRREVEEEYRRNAAVSSFIAGGKPGSSGSNSFPDTRLEPAIMAHRRMSDGSIADNQDYSRRILKVTNA